MLPLRVVFDDRWELSVKHQRCRKKHNNTRLSTAAVDGSKTSLSSYREMAINIISLHLHQVGQRSYFDI
jgi:hypothetical protein